MSKSSCPMCGEPVEAGQSCAACGASLATSSPPDFDDPNDKTDPNISIPPEFLEDVERGREEDTKKPVPPPRLPWGRIAIMLVYLMVAGMYLMYEHRNSDAARLTNYMEAAAEILGTHMGAASSSEDLILAAEHYLEALAIDPHIETAHRRIDLIQRRLEERRVKLPEELSVRHQALAGRARMERAKDRRGLFAQMPVTPSERFDLRERRNKLSRSAYLFIGGFGLLIGWYVLSASWSRVERAQPDRAETGDAPRSKSG